MPDVGRTGHPPHHIYRWYDRYLQRGEAGLQDQSPKPKHVWNRIPDEVRRKVVKLALKETELSPRELAITFIGRESYFVSEALVLSRLRSGLPTHLCSLSFEGQGAFTS